MSYLNIIQKTLNIELSEKELAKIELDPRKLKDLSHALNDFYHEFQMPDKDNSIFRPYISLNFIDGMNSSLQYNYKISDGDSQLSNFFEAAAKRYLLYAHEICLHDPLSYLLDYFQLAPYGQHAINRIPAIKQVLIELTRLKPLIERRIIHIVSDELFFGISDQNLFAGMKEIGDQIEQRIGADEFHAISFEVLLKLIYEQYKLKNNVDLYFPHSHFVDLYTTLLSLCGDKFTSEQIKPSYEVGVIGGLQLLASDKLTVNDIIGIREDDNVFTQWRLLVSSTLSEMEKNQSYFNDSETEFKNIIKEQNQKLQLDIFKNAGKSPFIAAIPKFKEKVFFGIGSFMTLNSTLPDKFAPSFGGISNTILVAIFELLSTLSVNELSNARIRSAKKSHFLLLK